MIRLTTMENKTSLTVSKHSKTHWNRIPTPFGKPDERKMRKSKTKKRIFFFSLSRPAEEGTQEKVFQLIDSKHVQM